MSSFELIKQAAIDTTFKSYIKYFLPNYTFDKVIYGYFKDNDYPNAYCIINEKVTNNKIEIRYCDVIKIGIQETRVRKWIFEGNKVCPELSKIFLVFDDSRELLFKEIAEKIKIAKTLPVNEKKDGCLSC